MSMTALVNVTENLDNTLLMNYSHGLMEKLVAKLGSSKHRGVLEESITSIGTIANVIENDFAAYYDHIMPLLKNFVMTAKGEKEGTLRGKAFECIGMIGEAVGKDKFRGDAKDAISEMMKTPVAADDLQKEYINQTSQRICKVLKKEFAPYLPGVLPNIFETLRIDPEVVAAINHTYKNSAVTGNVEDDEDEEYLSAVTKEGKTIKVKNSKFQEMLAAVQLLNTFCTETEGAFADFIQPTAQALLPFLDKSESEMMGLLLDEVRTAVFQT